VLQGVDDLELHHLYRAMGWLGQTLPEDRQQGSSKLVLRCTKDLIEEHLFARRRDQKSNVSLMPADLHKALTVQDLHDLVEYLLTLKEAPKVKK
jgi:hypothetical protein